MNKVTIILSTVSFVFLLVITSFYSIKRLLQERKKNKELSDKLEHQKQNLVYVVRHADEIAKIAAQKTETDKAIGDAKSDEEILSIINAVISSNNNRVRNSSKTE